eukprot:g649.t1
MAGGRQALEDLPEAPAEAEEAPAVTAAPPSLVLGETVKMDHLGPVIVNADGSLRRIANWQEMTEVERRATLRRIARRNQQRLARLITAGLPCPLGRWAEHDGFSECSECPVGRVGLKAGQSLLDEACSECPAGKSSTLGGLTCFGCTAGSWSSTGSDCQPCPSGRWSDAVEATAQAACQWCAAGRFSELQGASGSAVCESCAPGRWNDQPGQSACGNCTAGRFLATPGATAAEQCQACGKGRASGPGAFECSDCAPGRHAPNETSGACIMCSAGRYAQEALSSSCSSCPAGRFSVLPGGVHTVSPQAGPQDAVERLRALAGVALVRLRARESAVREQRPERILEPLQQEAGLGVAEPAELEEGIADLELALTDPLQRTLVLQMKQIAMLARQQQQRQTPDPLTAALFGISGGQSTGRGSVKGCLARKAYLELMQDHGKVALAVMEHASRELGIEHSQVGPGLMKEYMEKKCPLGDNRLLIQQAYLWAFAWETGFRTNNVVLMGACVDCSPGSSSEEAANACEACEPGRWVNVSRATACEGCPAGTASSQRGATTQERGGIARWSRPSPLPWHDLRASVGESECERCPAGRAVGRSGASAAEACEVCVPGRWAAETGTSQCQQCAPGRWQNTPGALECLACGAGTSNSALGASSESLCAPCPLGAWSASGAAFCPPCAAGRYGARQGARRCDVCPSGTFSAAEGATSAETCEPCPSGRFSSLDDENAESGATSCELCPQGRWSEDARPQLGGGVAGGTVVINVDEDLPTTAEDLQTMPAEVGDIHEMADRLREMQSMTLEDVTNNRSGSPTEVMEADSASEGEQEKPSPLEVLKRMVEDRDKKRKAEAEASLDIHDMGTSEVQKLKAHVPMELKMPWERGFAGLVLKGGTSVMETAFLDEDKWRPHAMLQDDVEVRGQGEDPVELKLKPSFKPDGRQKMPWAQALETERAKVFEGWKIVIDEARHSCAAARMLDQSGDSVLDDIFAKKKNGTLQVRLSAMMLYVRWARAKGLPPFPLSEDQVYRYVDQLRRDGAPATRANSFRSALAFCKGTIQLQDVDPVLQSGRVTGSAHRSYLTKRVLRQRDALTVRQACRPGSYSNESWSSCEACPMGRWSDSEGTSLCPWPPQTQAAASTALLGVGTGRRAPPARVAQPGAPVAHWARRRRPFARCALEAASLQWVPQAASTAPLAALPTRPRAASARPAERGATGRRRVP